MLLNARSIKNKDHVIIAELKYHKKFAVLTEIWIKSNQQDEVWLNQSKFKWGIYDIITHN